MNILLNISFCFLQNTECQMGLEWLEVIGDFLHFFFKIPINVLAKQSIWMDFDKKFSFSFSTFLSFTDHNVSFFRFHYFNLLTYYSPDKVCYFEREHLNYVKVSLFCLLKAAFIIVPLSINYFVWHHIYASPSVCEVKQQRNRPR